MDSNEIKLKIVSLYNECESLQQKVNANKSTINSYLQKFVVGTQIGDGVYSNDSVKSYDINLSGNKADYEEAMNLINRDIDDIDSIISKHNELKNLMSQAPMDNELLEIGYKALAMIEKMYQEREERITILNRIKQIYSLLEQQEEEMKHQQSEESADVGGSTGGGNYSSDSVTSSGDATVSDTTMDTTTTPTTTDTPSTNTTTSDTPSTFAVEDYQQALSFTLTNEDMNVAKSNLATHSETVKNILSNVNINGEVVGGDVYGVTGVSTSDVGFNFGALQLACDAVSADVSAISAYITQMRDKIASNKAAIESTKAEMDRTETVTVQDEKGNYYTEERKVHSGSEIAAYQAQIDAMEAENTQLEADITSYTTEMNQKKEVFNQLMNYRNAYNNTYGGLLNTFAANDLMNTLMETGPNGNLLGMSLTDSQKQELFRNMGSNLMNNQNNLSLVTTEGFDFSKGEYPLGAFQYLLGCCSLLGENQDSFEKNYNMMQDFRQQIATSLGIDLNQVSSTSIGENPATQDSTSVDGLKTENSAAENTSTGRPVSTKALDPAVESFMLNHKGQISTVSDDMKKALGLSMDAMISVPRGYNTTEEWPLLVWLAGTGTAGGSTENLKSSVFVKNIVSGQYTVDGAIMYVPVGWGSGSSEANNSVYSGTSLSHDFDCVVNGLNVDKNHISGMGISIGAFALAYLVDTHPNTFSAAAMCGGGFGGPFGDVTVDKAIQNSPETSFIWYNANNDETSGGVRTDALKSHEALLKAGMNSVYYEVGGDIWHVEACDRFATDAMVNDLIRIEKGQRYVVPNEVQKVSARAAYDASVSHGGKTNPWYVPLSSGTKTGSVTTLVHREVTTSLPKEKGLPDIFVNVSGAIPDLSANMSTLKDYLTETSTKATAENLASVENGATLQTLQHDGQLIYYYQKGYYDQNGQFHRWQSSWGKDIASAGCGPTSMAACLANMLHDPSITPTTIANMLNYDDNVGGTYVRKAAEYYGLDQTHTIGLDKTKMNNFLRNDGKMIVAVNGGGHYVAVVGIDDSSNPPKYIVNDPNDHDAKLKTWTYYQLAADHTMVFHIAPKGKTVDQCIKEQTYQVL